MPDNMFDKEQWKMQKEIEKAEVFNMRDEQLEQMENVDSLNEYLDVQSMFDRMSVNNALLITAQKPNATRLYDFNQLKTMNVSVNKDEKAIRLIEPGSEYVKSDGTKGRNYYIKKLFDVSQTNMKVKPKDEFHPSLKNLTNALITASSCKIEVNPNIAENVNAIYMPSLNSISARPGLDHEELVRALSFEIAVAKVTEGKSTREKNVVKAYCVSYMVCKKFGIQPTEYTFGVAPLEGMDNKAKKDFLESARTQANSIIKSMEKTLGELTNEAR